MGREDLTYLFHQLGYRKGAEIGTERGLFAETICKNNPGVKLYCIDPYLAYKGYREHTSQQKLDGFFEEAQQRLGSYNVEFLRMMSNHAAVGFNDGSLDFVYIDGNHSLLHVIQDLCAWVPKVRIGGCISGHDWIQRKNSNYNMHVPQAVMAYVNSYHIKQLFVLGSKEIVEGQTRDKPRSWLFFKE